MKKNKCEIVGILLELLLLMTLLSFKLNRWERTAIIQLFSHSFVSLNICKSWWFQRDTKMEYLVKSS